MLLSIEYQGQAMGGGGGWGGNQGGNWGGNQGGNWGPPPNQGVMEEIKVEEIGGHLLTRVVGEVIKADGVEIKDMGVETKVETGDHHKIKADGAEIRVIGETITIREVGEVLKVVKVEIGVITKEDGEVQDGD